MKYSVPTNDKDIARKYTKDTYSIMNALPFPCPEKRPFGAVIHPKYVFNNIVALDLDIKTYDNDEDWTDDRGNYTEEFYQKWHAKIREMKENGIIS